MTDALLDDVLEWQSRPLDDLYPIVYLDCIVIKVRQDKRVINKAIYLVLGINMQGQKAHFGGRYENLPSSVYIVLEDTPFFALLPLRMPFF